MMKFSKWGAEFLRHPNTFKLLTEFLKNSRFLQVVGRSFEKKQTFYNSVNFYKSLAEVLKKKKRFTIRCPNVLPFGLPHFFKVQSFYRMGGQNLHKKQIFSKLVAEFFKKTQSFFSELVSKFVP